MPISNQSIKTRLELIKILEENKKIVILKFGAEWCGPCKKIEQTVTKYMESMPDDITCMILDIDECFDLYAFLKTKKVTPSIPVILAYDVGNTNPIAPTDIMLGSNGDVDRFFQNCYERYTSI